MSTAEKTRVPWNTRDYARIVSASYQSGVLTVGFADGATGQVAVEAFHERPGTRDWDRLTHTQYEIVVPREADDDEIPWDVIRSLTDPAFAEHRRERAVASARWVGQRVRELREGRGLTVEDLAARSGLDPTELSRLEQGDHDGDLPELRRVVESMGYGMKELYRPRVGSPVATATTA